MTRNGTALTMTETRFGPQSAGAAAARTEAAFTAQLLAIRLDLPAYRQRRRIEPALAIMAYRDRLGRTALPSAAPIAQA